MTFTTKIDIALADKIKADLEERGFSLSKPAYTIFLAKKENISVALYESGTLTVQGKGKKEFIEFYLEPEILKTFDHGHVDLTPRIGMDEAGKGDFFGPLCIAAVYADEAGIKQMLEMGVKDSKQMTDVAILKLAKKIRATFPYTAIRLFPLKYNELYGRFKNLNRLLGWAHAAALADLSQKTGCKNALLDQFTEAPIVHNFLKQKKIDINLTQRTKGEEDPVVAAASIIARASFVEGMDQLSEEYGIEIPKGASGKVKDVARTLVAKHGREVLPKIVKIHFKTTGEL